MRKYYGYMHLCRAFADALPKDVNDPGASKLAEATLRLNKLFRIEAEPEGLPPEQKKKTSYPRERTSRGFLVMGRKESPGRAAKIKAFHSISLCIGQPTGIL